MASTGVIEFLQQFKCGFLDSLFRIITFFGEEIAFVVLFAIIFWCFSKTKAFNMLIVYLVSTATNFGIKTLVDAPRPPLELRDPNTIGTATSSSFPSGHSNSASNYLFSTTASFFRKKWWMILISVIGALLVALSRLYLGHHYLKDVLAGVLLGGVIGYFGIILIEKIKINPFWWLLLLIPLYLMMLVVDNSEIYVLVGGLTAAFFGYNIEKQYIKMEIPKSIIVKLVRMILGVGILYLIYLFFTIFNGSEISLIIGSFVAGAFIFVLAPLLFKLTDKITYKIIGAVKQKKALRKEAKNKEKVEVSTEE